jgi:hypothetical protein
MTPVPALLPFPILKKQSAKNKWFFSNLVFQAFSSLDAPLFPLPIPNGTATFLPRIKQ